MSCSLENKNVALRREGKFAVLNCLGQEFRIDYKPDYRTLRRQVIDVLKALKAPKALNLEALTAINDLLAEELKKEGAPQGPVPESGQDSPVFNFGNVRVSPILDRALEPLHPAIGLTSKFAYIGALMTSQEVRINRQGEEERSLVNAPFLVTSDRELVPLYPEALLPLGLRLEGTSQLIRGNWSQEGIKKFREGYSPDPVELYNRIRMQFVRYYEIEEEWYDFFALWTIGTYFFHLFTAYPYIYLMGTKASGKTKLLSLVRNMAFNAVLSANMSSASLFRLVQGGRCTLLMDETEDLRNPNRKEDMRSMLLAGYKKGEKVYRVEKDSRDRLTTVEYEIYSPKMTANIGGIEDILESRCITVVTKRGLDPEKINSEVIDTEPVWQEIRDGLHAFYLEHAQKVMALYKSPEDEGALKGINARDRELWKPFYVLAKYFDGLLGGLGRRSRLCRGHPEVDAQKKQAFFEAQEGTLTGLIERLAEANSRERAQEENANSIDHQILRVLYDLTEISDDYYPFSRIKKDLLADFDKEPDWITERWLGSALKRLGFKDKRRVKGKYQVLIERAKVEDIARRLKVSLGTEEGQEGPEKSPVFSDSYTEVSSTTSTKSTTSTHTSLTDDDVRRVRNALLEHQDMGLMLLADCVGLPEPAIRSDPRIQEFAEVSKDTIRLRQKPVSEEPVTDDTPEERLQGLCRRADTVRIKTLDEPFEGICDLCGQRATIAAYADQHLACQRCLGVVERAAHRETG